MQRGQISVHMPWGTRFAFSLILHDELKMSKETGKPLVVGPWSPPSDGGNPNTMLARHFHVVSPWSITGSSRRKGNDSTG